MPTSISRPPSGPALAQGSESGAPLTLATLLDAFQFSKGNRGLSVPLVRDGTVQSLPMFETINRNSDQGNFVQTYAMLQNLFAGHGARPRLIQAGQPWYAESHEGRRLVLSEGRFGRRITLTPEQVTLEQRKHFATAKEMIDFDPVSLQVLFYHQSFCAQLDAKKLRANPSSILSLTISNMEYGGSIADTYIEVDPLNWKSRAVSPSLDNPSVNGSFAELYVDFSTVRHLIRGARQYVPGQRPDVNGLDGLVTELWANVHHAAQQNRPPPPFTYGDPWELMGHLLNSEGVDVEELTIPQELFSMIQRPNQYDLNEWARELRELDPESEETPPLYEENSGEILNAALRTTGPRLATYTKR